LQWPHRDNTEDLLICPVVIPYANMSPVYALHPTQPRDYPHPPDTASNAIRGNPAGADHVKKPRILVDISDIFSLFFYSGLEIYSSSHRHIPSASSVNVGVG
jgi:hypothetical protein